MAHHDARRPRNEFPEFPAALSFAMVLGPERAAGAARAPRRSLRERLARFDRELGGEHDQLPRVTLLETEYQRAVVAAELGWLDAVIADLRGGTLTWSHEELAGMARSSMAE